MKNYSLNPEESRNFIKKYTIKNNSLVLDLGNKQKYVIPYNQENKKMVLDKMENQVKKNKESYLESLKFRLKFFASLLSIGTLILAIALIFSIHLTGLICILLSTLPFGIGFCISNDKYIDLKKQIYFLDNKDTINGYIRRNENMLLGLSKKTKKMVKSTCATENVFNINNIHKISLKELYEIKKNIKRYNEFKFDEYQTLSSPKTKAKVKK